MCVCTSCVSSTARSIQVFPQQGRVWFTTHGMIEGAYVRGGGEDGEGGEKFDYLGTARRLAEERYPQLLADPHLLDGRTLLFELIHPDSPKITDYGDRANIRFDRRFQPEADRLSSVCRGTSTRRRARLDDGRCVVAAGSNAGGPVRPAAARLPLAGTDQEGSVLNFKHGGEVVYRVKVKSAGLPAAHAASGLLHV